MFVLFYAFDKGIIRRIRKDYAVFGQSAICPEGGVKHGKKMLLRSVQVGKRRITWSHTGMNSVGE